MMLETENMANLYMHRLYLKGCERFFWTGLIQTMEFKKSSAMPETLGSDA